MRFSLVAAVLCAAALFGGGCMEATTDVYVKKDGSGTVTQTMFMTEVALGMIKQMGAAMGGAQAMPDPTRIDSNKKEELKQRAKRMGDGVKLVSAESVKHKDGRSGTKFVFSFADINKLKLTSEIDAPAMPGQPKQKPKVEPITFTFKSGATNVLTIKHPEPKKTPKELSGETAGKDMPKLPQPSPAELAQTKQMFKGMKIWTRVRIEGTISKTNASHVNKKKNGVTLNKIDFDKLLEDEKAFEKVMGMGKIKTVEEARQKFKDIPGMLFEPELKVSVEFK